MGRRLFAAAATAVVLVVALVGWRSNVFNIRGASAWSVAAAFDSPPAYPGYTWTRDGQPVSEFELVTIAGPDHCDWESAAVLFIGWPPPRVTSEGSQARQYVRDPRGVMTTQRADTPTFERNVRLPPDATPTGHRLGSIELYVSPSDNDRWIYLVSPSDAERWPRLDPMVLCA